MGNINKRELGIQPPIEYNHDEIIKRIVNKITIKMTINFCIVKNKRFKKLKRKSS